MIETSLLFIACALWSVAGMVIVLTYGLRAMIEARNPLWYGPIVWIWALLSYHPKSFPDQEHIEHQKNHRGTRLGDTIIPPAGEFQEQPCGCPARTPWTAVKVKLPEIDFTYQCSRCRSLMVKVGGFFVHSDQSAKALKHQAPFVDCCPYDGGTHREGCNCARHGKVKKFGRAPFPKRMKRGIRK